MKTMIYSLTLAALMITSFSSCSDDNDPVLTQKDWDGTTTYFASADKYHGNVAKLTKNAIDYLTGK